MAGIAMLLLKEIEKFNKKKRATNLPLEIKFAMHSGPVDVNIPNGLFGRTAIETSKFFNTIRENGHSNQIYISSKCKEEIDMRKLFRIQKIEDPQFEGSLMNSSFN